MEENIRLLFFEFINSLKPYGIECQGRKYVYNWVKYNPLTQSKLTKLFQDFFQKENPETKIQVIKLWEQQEMCKYILDFAQIVNVLDEYYNFLEQNNFIFGNDLHFEISVHKLSLGYTYYCLFDYSDKAILSSLTENLLSDSEQDKINKEAFHKLETIWEMIENLQARIMANYSGNVDTVCELINKPCFAENENYFSGCKMDADSYNGFFLNCSYC